MTPPEVSVVVPTYNGAARIAPTLEALERACARSKHTVEIIVVDNGSADGTSQVVEGFPKVVLRRVEPNRGFAGGVAAGVEISLGRILAVVSDDVIVDEDFFLVLLPYFDHVDTFSVMPRPLGEGEEEAQFYPVVPFRRRGRIHFTVVRDKELIDRRAQDEWLPTFFTMGGLALYDRERFDELGGFSNLYQPFFCEDTDVSWRAWSRGWRSYYEPRTEVRHHQKKGAVESNYKARLRSKLLQRNGLLLNIVNHDMHPALQLLLFAVEVFRRLSRPFKRRPDIFALALIDALWRLPYALRLREEERRARALSNHRALGLVRRPWLGWVELPDDREM